MEESAGVKCEAEGLQVGQPWLISQPCPRAAAGMPRSGRSGYWQGTAFLMYYVSGAPVPAHARASLLSSLRSWAWEERGLEEESPGWVP